MKLREHTVLTLWCSITLVFGAWYNCFIPKCCINDLNKSEDDNYDTSSHKPLNPVVRNPLQTSESLVKLFRSQSHLNDVSTDNSMESQQISPTRKIRNLNNKFNATKYDYLSIDGISNSATYSNRKDEIKSGMKCTRIKKCHLEPQDNLSSLLILDGRHTLFDSVPFNPYLIGMLRHQDTLFFKSENYPNTINVIRPSIIQFIHNLIKLCGTGKLFTVLYINQPHDITDKEQDEVISIITFIELYHNAIYNYNVSFKIDLVLFTHRTDEYKQFQSLIRYIPLRDYLKIIIVDASGLNLWHFPKFWQDPQIRNQSEFKSLKKQIIPFQPSLFMFNEEDTVKELKNKWNDTFFGDIVEKMQSCDCMDDLNDKFNPDFSRYWIQDSSVFEKERDSLMMHVSDCSAIVSPINNAGISDLGSSSNRYSSTVSVLSIRSR